MDYTFYAPTSEVDYDKLITEVVDSIDVSAETQRSLTTITLDCEDRENPDDAKVVIYSREWVPESRHPRHNVNVVPIDDVAAMSIQLPSKRMLRLPPRKDGGGYGYGKVEAPFTGLHYNDDIVLASPDVVRILEAIQAEVGLDIESMVKDLEATFNRHEETLNLGLQKGLIDLSGERTIATRMQRDLENKVRRAYIEIMNEVPELNYEKNLEAVIQDMIDAVQSGKSRVPTLLKEQRLTLDTLVADYNALQSTIGGAVGVSHDVFVETINEEGIGMPSIFETADEAVSAVGFDSERFLGL